MLLPKEVISTVADKKKFPFPFGSVQFKRTPNRTQNVIKTPFHFKAVQSFIACKLTGKLIQDVQKSYATSKVHGYSGKAIQRRCFNIGYTDKTALTETLLQVYNVL